MYRRTARLAAAFFAGMLAIVLLPLAITASPAGAEEQFTLGMVDGQLVLRGGDPLALENPTSLSGVNNDGQLSGVVLTTPAVTSTRPVPDFNTTVTITAAFSMVQPGTGTISEDGSMTVQVRLAVDLHLVVPLLPDPSDCRAAPINLTLTSTAPYDGERVTLRAANFTVPPVAASASCSALLVDPVNDALAGAGHALTLTVAGAITPPAAGEPTATTLEVSPANQARIGQEVTLTAAVTPDPEVPGAPPVSGVVTFFDGATSLGTAEVDPESGSATLSTTALPAGPRELRAAYGGAPPDWDPSQSEVLPYDVIANPAVVTTAAGEVAVGGPGKDFDVTVVNTGFGAALADARLEVQINRQRGNGAIGPNGTEPRIVLSRVVGATATPIPLTYSSSGGQRLTGVVGDAATWALAPGAEHTEALRLEVAAGTLVGPLNLTFTLVTGEGDQRVVLGTTTGVITMVNEARQATTIAAGEAGFPPFVPSFAPVTTVVRQGNVAHLYSLRVDPAIGSIYATGTYSFAIDGVPVLAQVTDPNQPGAFVWADRVVKSSIASGHYLIKVPTTMPTGVRQVTVNYSGDALFAPSQATFPITVEPAIGVVYECRDALGVGSSQTRFTANVEVQATLPTMWPAGQDLPINRVQVRMRLSRTSAHANLMSGVLTALEENRDWRLELGPDGVITPATVASSNEAAWPMGGDANPSDRIIEASAGAGVLSVSATPGESTDYSLDEIVLTARDPNFGTNSGVRCTPETTPYVVGTVTSVGATLAVDPAGPVGTGRPVTLSASALPAAPGVVEFRDGTRTVGVVPVDSAGAAQVTATLPAGTRSLTARFFGQGVVSTPSAPVEVRVIGDCGSNVDPGNGAAVRLVYMQLLGRCADRAGYDFWTQRLDSGAATREQFAFEISKSLEARGVIVDDGYRTMLDRAAEPAGRDFWARRLANGRYDDLLADLASSPEFWNQAGRTNAGFVELVYQRVLRRAPEPEGRAYWTDRLNRGESRRKLVLTLFNLPEPLGVVVRDAYEDLLDRTPTADERGRGVALMSTTSNRSLLYASIIGTEDFFDRAQEFPERS